MVLYKASCTYKTWFILCIIPILCIGFKNVNSSPTTCIVKVKEENATIVNRLVTASNWTVHSKIIDGIYIIFKHFSDERLGGFFNKTDLLQYLSAITVEYLYESYDLFPQSPVVAGPVSGHTLTTMSPRNDDIVHTDYKACPPVYDPLFGIDNAWENNSTGENVVIAITDVGVDENLPKLRSRINESLSWNFFTDENKPFSPEIYTDIHASDRITNHGNACAGLAAGTRNPDIKCLACGCGVAPGATIACLKVAKLEKRAFMFQNPQPTKPVHLLCKSLSHRQNDIDIYSNSWNFNVPLIEDKCIYDVMKKGHHTGRNGKGNIYVFPADPPGNGFVNNIFTIAVGDMGVNGTLPDEPQVNSAVVLSMLANGRHMEDTRLLTELQEWYVHNRKRPCSISHGGQSMTSAMVSGVIAIILGINKQLTARDVKHVLIESASNKGIEEESSFKTNGAGYHFHNVFGFGYPNVTKAITLANNWASPQPLIEQRVRLDIQGLTGTLNVLQTIIEKLEEVILEVIFHIKDNINISIELISPQTTTSTLVENIAATTALVKAPRNFSSNHFWGENPNGKWMLRVAAPQSAIELVEVSIIFYGTGTSLGRTSKPFDAALEFGFSHNDYDSTRFTNHANISHSSDSKKKSLYIKPWVIAMIVICVTLILVVIALVVHKKRQRGQNQNYEQIIYNINGNIEFTD